MLVGRVEAEASTTTIVTVLVAYLVVAIVSVMALIARRRDETAKTQVAMARLRYFLLGPEDEDRLAAIEAQLAELATELRGFNGALPLAEGGPSTWREWWSHRPSRHGRSRRSAKVKSLGEVRQ